MAGAADAALGETRWRCGGGGDVVRGAVVDCPAGGVGVCLGCGALRGGGGGRVAGGGIGLVQRWLGGPGGVEVVCHFIFIFLVPVFTGICWRFGGLDGSGL